MFTDLAAMRKLNRKGISSKLIEFGHLLVDFKEGLGKLGGWQFGIGCIQEADNRSSSVLVFIQEAGGLEQGWSYPWSRGSTTHVRRRRCSIIVVLVEGFVSVLLLQQSWRKLL